MNTRPIDPSNTRHAIARSSRTKNISSTIENTNHQRIPLARLDRDHNRDINFSQNVPLREGSKRTTRQTARTATDISLDNFSADTGRRQTRFSPYTKTRSQSYSRTRSETSKAVRQPQPTTLNGGRALISQPCVKDAINVLKPKQMGVRLARAKTIPNIRTDLPLGAVELHSEPVRYVQTAQLNNSLTTHVGELQDASPMLTNFDYEGAALPFSSNRYAVNNHACHCVTAEPRIVVGVPDYTHYLYYEHDKSFDDDWLLSDDIDENALPVTGPSLTRYAYRQRQALSSNRNRTQPSRPVTVSYKSGFHNSIDRFYDFNDEYRKDFYMSMCRSEARYAPNPRYIEQHEQIYNYTIQQMQSEHAAGRCIPRDRPLTSNMRMQVVDWLLEVLDEYKSLSPESFHLAVSIMDKYLSKQSKNVTRTGSNQFQEIGVTALVIASKFVDYQTPRLREFSDVTECSVKKKDLLDRERDFLTQLTCELSAPTPYHFLLELITCFGLTIREARPARRLALYFCDLARLDYALLRFRNRIIGVACLFMGMAYSPHVCSETTPLITSRQEPINYLDINIEELVDCIYRLQHFHSAHKKTAGSSYNTHEAAIPESNSYVFTRWTSTVELARRRSETEFQQMVNLMIEKW